MEWTVNTILVRAIIYPPREIVPEGEVTTLVLQPLGFYNLAHRKVRERGMHTKQTLVVSPSNLHAPACIYTKRYLWRLRTPKKGGLLVLWWQRPPVVLTLPVAGWASGGACTKQLASLEAVLWRVLLDDARKPFVKSAEKHGSIVSRFEFILRSTPVNTVSLVPVAAPLREPIARQNLKGDLLNVEMDRPFG
ncbi:hypothetical protein HYDPIDRAFT_120511 [Hydnomerulius pinastri MD-312]|uniref:Uncharacterized protein n=1 Tax=Hydnomerulius pinastri MD-312 TaxID=994086 RepID=A0A0C9VJL0_9AGAM|nr:hypothetical protein HYDPIDRAFT_120511 [Hydnomerulius pinastri MD-312]